MTTSLRTWTWVACAMVCTPAFVRAEEAAPPPGEASGLETVVVTGSAISGGVTKLEAYEIYMRGGVGVDATIGRAAWPGVRR